MWKAASWGSHAAWFVALNRLGGRDTRKRLRAYLSFEGDNKVDRPVDLMAAHPELSRGAGGKGKRAAMGCGIVLCDREDPNIVTERNRAGSTVARASVRESPSHSLRVEIVIMAK